MHSLAATYGQRPSNWLGLTPDSWEAYQFDLATLELGRFIENQLAETDGKGNAKHSLAALLSVDDGKEAADKEQFRSLAGSGVPIRKVRIPESGIWDIEELLNAETAAEE